MGIRVLLLQRLVFTLRRLRRWLLRQCGLRCQLPAAAVPEPPPQLPQSAMPEPAVRGELLPGRLLRSMQFGWSVGTAAGDAGPSGLRDRRSSGRLGMLHLRFNHSNLWWFADRSLLGVDGDSHDRAIRPGQFRTSPGSARCHVADSHSDPGDPRLFADADFTPGALVGACLPKAVV
jgi:hypothetical protein